MANLTDFFGSPGDLDKNLSENTKYTLMLADNEVLKFDLATYEFKLINRDLLPIALTKADERMLVAALKEWLQNRAIQVGRSHKDKILKACGLSGVNDLYMLISQYRALSLTDNYWIKGLEEDVSYSEVNLFDNPFSKAMFPVALVGIGDLTLRNATPELNQRGVMAKAFCRTPAGIYLYKTGDAKKLRAECFASKIASYCGMYSVVYKNVRKATAACTRCKLETSKTLNWVPARDFIAVGVNPSAPALKFSPQRYYEMRIFDYIAGNIDRHNENWSFEVDNANNILGLSKLYDFDNCFIASDTEVSGIDLKPLEQAAIESFKAMNTQDYFTSVKGYLRSCKQKDKDLAAYTLRRIEVLERSVRL